MGDEGNRLGRLAALVGLATFADLGSKALAGPLGFSLHTNPDLSLGLVDLDGPLGPIALMTAAAVVAIGHACWSWYSGRMATVVLGVLLGGMLANLVDRLADGSVTDWLPVGPIVLNVADVEVWVGLIGYGVAIVRATERGPVHWQTNTEGRTP
jgi:lipoprotein signal peptidase